MDEPVNDLKFAEEWMAEPVPFWHAIAGLGNPSNYYPGYRGDAIWGYRSDYRSYRIEEERINENKIIITAYNQQNNRIIYRDIWTRDWAGEFWNLIREHYEY